MSTSTGTHTGAFWEKLWRSAGLQFVGFFIVAWVIYGSPPPVGATNDALVAFYEGDRLLVGPNDDVVRPKRSSWES